MSEVWLTIAVLGVATAMIRACGPVALGGRDLPPRLQGVIALLAPALLAALVAVETVGAPEGGAFELDARIAGVAAAGLALLVLAVLSHRDLVAGAATLPVVALAALITALTRALL